MIQSKAAADFLRIKSCGGIIFLSEKQAAGGCLKSQKSDIFYNAALRIFEYNMQ